MTDIVHDVPNETTATRQVQAVQTEQIGDPDAQGMVIASLRSQIQDLFSQVTQLNSKLVKSYDRVSDLEDDLHVASSNLRTSSLKVSQLELERTQHLAALNTGLLVEKSHVTAELTRLMEKATEEAAQRGQAETARADIEKELDDLTANLFEQANSMVAEARLARALSERKVEEAGAALKGAEEAVGIMQERLQVLESEKEAAEKDAENMRALMGKGKWPAHVLTPTIGATKALKLLSSHLPYSEFLLFVAHLRSIHPSSPHPPVISALLPLPFLARLLAEDSEPTIRLDLAPSLNWLSRRSVLTAIHTGQLTIEPVAASALHETLSSHSSSPIMPGTSGGNPNISCALCGAPLFPNPSDKTSPRFMPRMTSSGLNGTTSWSTNLFRNPLSYSQPGSMYESPPPTPPADSRSSSPQPPSSSQQIHIFRISSNQSPATTLSISLSATLPLTTAVTSHHPASHGPPQGRGAVPSTIYPLCTSGWCLARLRTTCSLWAFVRSGIIEKVWEEEVPVLLPPPKREPEAKSAAAPLPPPVPPRRRGLWGMASALSERAASWGEGDKASKDKDKKLPVPPPAQLSLDLKAGSAAVPPPLPRRAEGRAHEASNPPPPPPPQAAASTLTQVGDENGKGGADLVQALPPDESPAKKDQSPPAAKRSPVVRKPAPSIDNGPPPVVEAATTTAEARQPTPVDATSDSEEAFATPPEESTPHAAMAHVSGHEADPTTVPLPESRMATPVMATPVMASFAQAQQMPTLPVDADFARVKPKRLSRGGDVGTGGAVAPPPLPRRAAARVARGGASVPTHRRTASGASMRTSVVGASANAGPAAAVVVAAAAAVVEPRAAKETGETRASADKGRKEGEMTSMAETKPSSVLSVSVYSGTGKDSVVEPRPSLLNGVHDAKAGVQAAVGDGEQEEDKERDAGQAYVGDATWEERTWKELVRLKEEMFLARIGGLR